jgi:hypothetical protein
MTQQTALQSFWDKIALKLSVQQVNEFLPELQKALEMEKKQTMKAYKNGYVIQRVSKPITKTNNHTHKLKNN